MRVTASAAALAVDGAGDARSVPRPGPGNPPFGGTSGEWGVCDELSARAHAGGPLRRVSAALAGHFVAMRGWERLGFARLGDYAAERLGLSARQLRDFARVDAALADLPAIEAALSAGTLSWTKTRLLCRVAGVHDEAAWLTLARRLTATALAHRVREADTGAVESGAIPTDDDGAFEEPRETVAIRCTPGVRARFHRARQLARRVAGESLPVWECMEAVAAEALSAVPLAVEVAAPPLDRNRVRRRRADCHRSPAPASLSPASAREWERPRSELDSPREPPAEVKALGRDLEAADAFALDTRLRRAVALAQKIEAALGPGLARVAEGRLYRAHGARTLDAYARDYLGLSPRKARMLLRLEGASQRTPALGHAYRVGAISWVRAHVLVPVLGLPGAPARAWIAHAQAVSVRRLIDDVDVALARHDGHRKTRPASVEPPPRTPGGDSNAPGAEPARRAPPANRQTGAEPTAPETARFFFTAPADVARLFRATVCTVQRRIERVSGRLPTPGVAVEAMFDHAFEVWSRDAGGRTRVRRAHRVFERDGWRCTAPGCSSYRNLQDHHIVFRSRGGSDVLANRTTLCAWHHLRGVHAGVVDCRGRAPDGIHFSLGVRADGPPLLRYGPGEVMLRAGPRPACRHPGRPPFELRAGRLRR